MTDKNAENKQMSQKDKMLKGASVCYIITKILYIIACVATTLSIVLAIVLPLTNSIKGMSQAEVAILFSIIGLYCFMLIGLLWNVKEVFRHIYIEKTPFCERVSHYLKKAGWFTIVTSIVPALIGSILIKCIVGETELRCDFQFVGLIVGIITLLLVRVFNYGINLQKQDDETLW